MMKTKLFLLATAFSVPVLTEAQVSIQDVGGWFESGYVTFTPIDEAASYSVYYKTAESEYQKIDDQLVRNYDSYGRADAMGLTAGTYSFKIVPVDSTGAERTDLSAETQSFTVKAHDRTGYAFFNGKTPGAYTADGEVKTQHRSIVPHREKQKYTLDGRCHEFKRSKNDLHRIAGNTQRI